MYLHFIYHPAMYYFLCVKDLVKVREESLGLGVGGNPENIKTKAKVPQIPRCQRSWGHSVLRG